MDAAEQFFLNFRVEKYGGKLFEPNTVASSGMGIGEIFSMPGARYLKTPTYDSESVIQLIVLFLSFLAYTSMLKHCLQRRVQDRFFQDKGLNLADETWGIFRFTASIFAVVRLPLLYAG
ncbi:hypothetical protein BDZ45DRAFT_739489 [Acephala macrosclerotiorum]|nr:hypothetical protein BDZ45DRAFT_739489 [Acephala macrosclerotiorum]